MGFGKTTPTLGRGTTQHLKTHKEGLKHPLHRLLDHCVHVNDTDIGTKTCPTEDV